MNGFFLRGQQDADEMKEKGRGGRGRRDNDTRHHYLPRGQLPISATRPPINYPLVLLLHLTMLYLDNTWQWHRLGVTIAPPHTVAGYRRRWPCFSGCTPTCLPPAYPVYLSV